VGKADVFKEVLSTKMAPQPLKENYLLTGVLEPTNEPYTITTCRDKNV
jgi:hypothetical protein